MLAREALGYAPGGMSDTLLLSRDLDRLHAAIERGASEVLLETAAECLAEAKRIGIPDVIAQTLLQQGRILISAGRYAQAIAVLREAERVLGDLREHDLKVRILARLAETYAGLGAWHEASEVCEAGIRVVEAHRYDVSSQYLQSAYLRSRIDLYTWGVRAAFETGCYPPMLERAELSKCRSVLRQRDKEVPPSAALASRVRAFRAVSTQIDTARAKGLGDAALAALQAKRRTLWDLLLIERAQAGGERDLPQFELGAVHAALEADEAILYYYWLDRTSLLVALIDRERMIAKRQPVTPELRSALDQFCRDILGRLSPDMPGYRTYFNRLAEFAPLLLPPEIISRLAGTRRLLISPHRMLHALPFHALPWDSEHRYLIERFAVTYVPNLRSMLMTYEKPAMPSLLALGIGDHRIAGHDPSPLPEVDIELEQLQEQWRKIGIKYFCLAGAQASRNRMSALARNGKLSQFTALHIATHGQNVNSDTPMESCLYLYDSIIDGLEIADWQLNAELIVLSACSSGQRAIEDQRRLDLPGDDLFGLQAAFFAAGARRVIGSLWPVLSSAAQTIMTGLHGHLTEGQTPEIALRSAILDYLRSARVKDRSPFYWAPFFLSAVARPAIRP